MRSLNICRIYVVPLAALMLLAVGCTTNTNVYFDAAPGTVMFVDGKPYHLPAQIALSRPTSVGQSTQHSVSLVSTVPAGELHAAGQIDIFGYAESDLDKKGVPRCILSEDRLSQIFEGKTVIFKGQTLSRQHLYEMTLKKQ